MSYHHLTGLLTRGMAVLAHVCTYGPQGMLPPIDAAMHCSILGTRSDHMLTHHFFTSDSHRRSVRLGRRARRWNGEPNFAQRAK